MKDISEELSLTIIDSVKDVFLAFLSIEAFPGPKKIVSSFDSYTPPDSEVVGLIEYAGALRGGVHLACPTHVACTLSGIFAGMEMEQFDADAKDGLGELANMIAGGIQTRMMDEYGLGDITISPPLVTTGGRHAITYQSYYDGIKQYFKIEGGLFFVECFYLPYD